MTHQDIIFAYNIKSIKPTSDENKEKYQLREQESIQYQILQTNIIRIIWQTVKRIPEEILEVIELNLHKRILTIDILFSGLRCK